jgi:hypothetical protein
MSTPVSLTISGSFPLRADEVIEHLERLSHASQAPRSQAGQGRR